jgi:hypothetical protein
MLTTPSHRGRTPPPLTRADRRRSARPTAESLPVQLDCRESGANGTWTLQLVLDEGAREEVLTITADDADNLQDVLKKTKNVFYDVGRRVLMLGHQNRRLNAWWSDP